MCDNGPEVELGHLLEEIDAEIAEADVSIDPPDVDEPVLEPYETRLRSLRGAVIAMETYEQGGP